VSAPPVARFSIEPPPRAFVVDFAACQSRTSRASDMPRCRVSAPPFTPLLPPLMPPLRSAADSAASHDFSMTVVFRREASMRSRRCFACLPRRRHARAADYFDRRR